MTISTILLYLMAAFYIAAGFFHFKNPRFFIKITPPYIPHPEKVNVFVGLVEILLGIFLLVEKTQSIAAWGIIALLVAVFPANIYHHQLARKKGKDVIGTLIRLPFQALFIYWAWCYT